MINIFKKIDKILCTYLGLGKEEVSPNTVSCAEGNLLVSSTSSYKRHSYTQQWDQIENQNLEQINAKNKEKLGIAIGKAIGANLVISFDEAQIKKEVIDA